MRDSATRDVCARLNTHPIFCQLSSFTEPPPSSSLQSIVLPDGVGLGESVCMRLSPDGSAFGFLHAPASDIYNRRLYVVKIGDHAATDAFATLPEAQDETTYEPPTSFEFTGAEGSSQLILQKGERGRCVLAHVDLDSGDNPRYLTTEGSVKAFSPLGASWDTILVTSTSLIHDNLISVIDTATAAVLRTVPTLEAENDNVGVQFGLSRAMWSDVYFRGADDLDIHAFVVRPSNFDPMLKYPWVLMPHGGPVSAWTDSWSTRVSSSLLILSFGDDLY